MTLRPVPRRGNSQDVDRARQLVSRAEIRALERAERLRAEAEDLLALAAQRAAETEERVRDRHAAELAAERAAAERAAAELAAVRAAAERHLATARREAAELIEGRRRVVAELLALREVLGRVSAGLAAWPDPAGSERR